MKKGILLINLGTPDSPEVKDVAAYLRQFLMDGRVIDVNPVWRYILVNWIIVPSRSKNSAQLYKKIWTERGSPLLYHGLDLKKKVSEKLGDTCEVALGMRYQSPSILSAVQELQSKHVDSIHVLPLYPHYASSSTQSCVDETEKAIREAGYKGPVTYTTHFFHRPEFIECFRNNALKFDLESYDHFLFSYHGLPERHIYKSAKELKLPNCRIDSCCDILTRENERCYRASSYATSRMLVKALNIPEGKYTTAFQSRLNDKWLKPYSDKVIRELGDKGNKRILAFSPSFVADCLETTYEVGTEYLEIFREHGGETVDLVPSLNSNGDWVNLVCKLVRQ